MSDGVKEGPAHHFELGSSSPSPPDLHISLSFLPMRCSLSLSFSAQSYVGGKREGDGGREREREGEREG